MSVDAIIGLQLGDEGKGRFVDLAAPNYDVVARGNGGANAGHTILPDKIGPIALHQVPSGIAYPDKLNIIGNGVYLDPLRLDNEINELNKAGIPVTLGSLAISNTAHLVLPHHIKLDEQREHSVGAQGTTKVGISFVAADKVLREGVRVELLDEPKYLEEKVYAGLRQTNPELLQKGYKTRAEHREESRRWLAIARNMRPFVKDTVQLVNIHIQAGDRILAEGAQSHWLDVDHGMYPEVTSSSTVVHGLLNGLGIAPKHLNKVTGIAKLIKSRVGQGPFVTEINDPDLIENIRGKRGEVDAEFGATTKRARRVGYPDLVELKNAIEINGVDELIISKMDHAERFGPKMLVATSYTKDEEQVNRAPSSARELARCKPVYREINTWHNVSEIRHYNFLPREAKVFVELVEEHLETPITKLGVGPRRNQAIRR